MAIEGLSRTHDNDKRPRGWKMIKNSLFIYLLSIGIKRPAKPLRWRHARRRVRRCSVLWRQFNTMTGIRQRNARGHDFQRAGGPRGIYNRFQFFFYYYYVFYLLLKLPVKEKQSLNTMWCTYARDAKHKGTQIKYYT